MKNCILELYSLEFNEGHLFSFKGVIKMYFSFKVWCVNRSSFGDFIAFCFYIRIPCSVQENMCTESKTGIWMLRAPGAKHLDIWKHLEK